MRPASTSKCLQFSWLPMLLLLTLATSISARADLYAFFTSGSVQRYFPQRNQDNGCKDHAAELQTSYKEAADLIDAAVSAIADMKQEAPSSYRGVFTTRARWNWEKKAETMTSMFGVRISDKGGPIKEDVEAFNYVENIFKQMKDGMDNDRVDTPYGWRIPGLYCGSEVGPDAWRFMQPHEPDPNLPGRTIVERNPRSFSAGAWYFNYNYIKVLGSTPTDPKLCAPDTMAFAIASSHFITFCDLAWTKLSKRINPSDVRREQHLDDPRQNSLSGVWVHELAHFYGSYKALKGKELGDQPAVDFHGNPVIRSDGTPAVTYGVERVIMLAKKSNELATHTADAYCWFAVAMYLSDWNWSGGFASKYSLI